MGLIVSSFAFIARKWFCCVLERNPARSIGRRERPISFGGTGYTNLYVIDYFEFLKSSWRFCKFDCKTFGFWYYIWYYIIFCKRKNKFKLSQASRMLQDNLNKIEDWMYKWHIKTSETKSLHKRLLLKEKRVHQWFYTAHSYPNAKMSDTWDCASTGV